MMMSQITLNDAASPIMESLNQFHDKTMAMVIFIMFYVGSHMLSVWNMKYSTKSAYEDHELETSWTIMPALSLTLLALPSIRLLYMMDESSNPILTLKGVGYQWYWSYDYSNYPHLEFDSYMKMDIEEGHLRLLEVDNSLVLPWGVEIRMLITANDVIHAWSMPALGIKADAIPGRLNQMSLYSSKPGTFYGQCSEICGANHSFMPITTEFISSLHWLMWTADTH